MNHEACRGSWGLLPHSAQGKNENLVLDMLSLRHLLHIQMICLLNSWVYESGVQRKDLGWRYMWEMVVVQNLLFPVAPGVLIFHGIGLG